jgi:hypothetical protein
MAPTTSPRIVENHSTGDGPASSDGQGEHSQRRYEGQGSEDDQTVVTGMCRPSEAGVGETGWDGRSSSASTGGRSCSGGAFTA